MIEFFVAGSPAPQGSKRAVRNKHTGQIQQVESSKRLKPWRADIRAAAEQALSGDPDAHLPLWEEPLIVTLDFYVRRPKGHYGTGRNAGRLKESAPVHPTVIPDLDKLARGVFDSLTGVVWADDKSVVALDAGKAYADERRPGVLVRVEVAP